MNAPTHSLPVRRFLARPVLCTSALALAVISLPRVSFADILGQYTFGTSVATATASPTTVSPNLTATAITGDTGLAAFDFTSPGGVATAPYLRLTFITTNTTPAAAFAANADFQFTLTASAGYQLDLSSLTFLVEKGGNGVRGYDVRASATNDGFATSLGTAALPDGSGVRPNMNPVAIDLSGPMFQHLSTITFRIYSFSNGAGSSVEYDNVTVNGIASLLSFLGYTWKGNINTNWDTASANWTGTGSTYVDAAADSDVLFDDTAASGVVNVTTAVQPDTVFFSNSTAKNYTLNGGTVTIATSLTKSGNGSLTINNVLSANTTFSVAAGSVVIGATGTVTAPTLTVSAGSTLTVSDGGTIGSTTGLVADGTVVFNGPAQTLAALNGAAGSSVTLNGTTLEITGGSTFSGSLSGTGSLLKSGSGVLVLNGPAPNTYTGTTTGTGGDLILSKTAGINAVPGNITLTGGGLLLGAASQIPDAADITIGDLLVGGNMRTNTNAETLHNLTITVPVGSAYAIGNTVTSVLSNLTVTGTLSITNGEHDLMNSNAFLTANTFLMDGSIGRLGANSNPSILNVGAGGLSMTNAGLRFGTAGAAFPAQLNLGGNFTASGTNEFFVANFTGPRVVDLQGGTRTFNIIDGTTNLPVTIQNGSLTKSGNGTLNLSGTNSYTGATTLGAGTLAVTGSIAGSSTSINGGTLTGTGFLGSLTLAGGTLSPGTGPGILTAGNLALTAGTLAIEITGNVPGNGFFSYDQVNIAGTVSLNGPVALTLDFSLYDPVEDTDSFVIVNNDSTDPVIFATPNARLFFDSVQLDEGTVFSATSGPFTQIFRITYAGGIDSNDIVLLPIPEPTTASLLACALLPLALRRRPPSLSSSSSSSSSSSPSRS